MQLRLLWVVLRFKFGTLRFKFGTQKAEIVFETWGRFDTNFMGSFKVAEIVLVAELQFTYK